MFDAVFQRACVTLRAVAPVVLGDEFLHRSIDQRHGPGFRDHLHTLKSVVAAPSISRRAQPGMFRIRELEFVVGGQRDVVLVVQRARRVEIKGRETISYTNTTPRRQPSGACLRT